MIRHIVMWKLKGEAEGRCRDENAREMKRLLELLPAEIPEILELRVGIADGHSESSCDLVLESSFEDWETFEVYQSHPEHLKVAEFVKAVRLERHVVDSVY